MERFIPFEKLSKKKQRQLNAQKRGSWGAISPVTRRPENPKAYNRKKARRWKEDSMCGPFYLSYAFITSSGRQGFSPSA
jgi:hypothetical protein